MITKYIRLNVPTTEEQRRDAVQRGLSLTRVGRCDYQATARFARTIDQWLALSGANGHVINPFHDETCVCQAEAWKPDPTCLACGGTGRVNLLECVIEEILRDARRYLQLESCQDPARYGNLELRVYQIQHEDDHIVVEVEWCEAGYRAMYGIDADYNWTLWAD